MKSLTKKRNRNKEELSKMPKKYKEFFNKYTYRKFANLILPEQCFICHIELSSNGGNFEFCSQCCKVFHEECLNSVQQGKSVESSDLTTANCYFCQLKY